MSLQDLSVAMKKQPKFIRTLDIITAVIMNPSYGEKFDEYKMIGVLELESRAKMIK